MKFVSIVGTQIMGTLQPWLSIVKKYGPDEAVLLYTTGKHGTGPIAERLRALAEDRNLGPVVLQPVAYGLTAEDCAPEMVERIAKEEAGAGRQICFNLDGGLNYMICACVLRLEAFEPLLVQSSHWRCVLYDAKTDRFIKLKLPETFPVREILDLQGVPWRQAKVNPDVAPDMPLMEICAKHNISLPKNNLANVVIDDIVFDLVWNPGNNRLRFLKDWRFYIEKDRLAKERSFAQWSNDRNRSGQMFDKQVFVLVASDESRERLAKESCWQLTLKKVEAWQNKSLFPYEDVKDALNAWFSQNAKGGKDETMKPPIPNTEELQDNTLAVCIGTNLVPTLLAICSRKPAHVVLCHTPPRKDDNIVCEYVRRLVELAPELGTSVTDVTLDIDGCFAEQVLPQAPAGAQLDVNVNISPGSKGQGAMLALWAKRHGFSVWSLDTGSRCCRTLYPETAGESLPFELCDPDLYFRLQGIDLQNKGLNEKDLKPELPVMDAMLEFMRAAIAAGKDKDIDALLDLTGRDFVPGKDRDMREHSVRLGKSVLIHTGYGLRFKSDQIDYRFEKKGKWLEKLMGVALLRAGATHVRVGMAMTWEGETAYNIIARNKLEETPHRLELDVAGAYAGDFVLVSCKSYRNAEQFDPEKSIEELIGKTTAEARNTGVNLGRFGLCMLVHMHCDKAYASENGRVMVIGWRDMCRPEELRKRIDELRALQRTSH